MSAPILIGLALRDGDAAPAHAHEPGLPRPVPDLDAPLLNGTLAAPAPWSARPHVRCS